MIEMYPCPHAIALIQDQVNVRALCSVITPYCLLLCSCWSVPQIFLRLFSRGGAQGRHPMAPIVFPWKESRAVHQAVPLLSDTRDNISFYKLPNCSHSLIYVFPRQQFWFWVKESCCTYVLSWLGRRVVVSLKSSHQGVSWHQYPSQLSTFFGNMRTSQQPLIGAFTPLSEQLKFRFVGWEVKSHYSVPSKLQFPSHFSLFFTAEFEGRQPAVIGH